ncbi:homeobox-containing protein 1-like isoform X6 [Arapaima gigas]
MQSPGGHSNSDDIDGNDYSEQVPGWPPSWQPTCPSPGQDDSTSHSDHQDPITLAVEMAAVNHTILALSRQGAADGGGSGGSGSGGDIKTEFRSCRTLTNPPAPSLPCPSLPPARHPLQHRVAQRGVRRSPPFPPKLLRPTSARSTSDVREQFMGRNQNVTCYMCVLYPSVMKQLIC